ncbi:hypothetical protein OHV74_18100 [Acinetobacter baumannii]|nr:hypothetical protein [Acinetobacter baumannii]
MKPEQFIREFGEKKAREVVEGAPDLSLFYDLEKQKHVLKESISIAMAFLKNRFLPIEDLKRLVESLDLLETCGGIDSCRKKLSTCDECKPNATHFAIHPEKPHLIQMYRRNEPKLEPNYSFADLKKAVAVHESIYGGGDD